MNDAGTADLVAQAAQRAPDGLAAVYPGGALTFRELEHYVRGTARALAAWTDAPRVGLVPPRSRQALIVLLSLLRAGRTACLMSTRWPRAAVRRAAQQVDAPWPVLGADTMDGLVQPDSSTSTVDLPRRYVGPATIVYTSGSTGEPKAVVHSVGNHRWSAQGANAVVPLGQGDRWLLSLPLYHVAGLGVVFRCLVAGATIVIPASGDAPEQHLQGGRCTHASLVFTQLRQVLLGGRAAPPVLKAVLVGGSGVPTPLLRRARACGYPVCTTYGLTEMASQVTTLAPNASPERLHTAGRVLPNRALRISARGEILVRGRVLFHGYADQGGIVHRPSLAGGWFATGDLGHLDAQGYLHVTGRLDNMFVSGGENIVPEAIERALCAVEGVERAVVVPVPDETFGARPAAFVAGTVGRSVLAAELRMSLPGFMVPAFLAWPREVPGRGMKTDRAAFARLARQWLRDPARRHGSS